MEENYLFNLISKESNYIKGAENQMLSLFQKLFKIKNSIHKKVKQ